MGTRGVTTKHPLYSKHEYGWMVVRDAVAGSDAVKMKDTVYLPMPTAMTSVRQPTSVSRESSRTSEQTNFINTEWDPNWHANPAYKAYKTRSEFPEIVSATLRGLMGIAQRNPPEISLPGNIAYLETEASADGMSLEQLYAEVLANNIQVGRHVLLLDVRPDNTLYISSYVAEDFPNWQEDVIDELSRKYGLVLAVLREYRNKTSVVDAGLEEALSHERETLYRVLYLDETGTYTAVLLSEEGEYQVINSEAEVTGEDAYQIHPAVFEQTLDEIPLVVAGSTSVDPTPDIAPLKGLSNLALSIYRKTADQAQNQFMSCNPMLVVTGVEKDEVPQVIGSTVTWVLPPADAKAGYTQTDTAALQYVETNIANLFDRAETAGAQLLGANKKAAEAAETLRMRQGAQGATLSSVVDNTTEAFEQILRMAASWTGANPDDVVFRGNKDFAEIVLSAQDISELLKSWMSGGISWDSYFWNMHRAGFLPEDITPEQERARIEASSASLPLTGLNDDDEDEEEEDAEEEGDMDEEDEEDEDDAEDEDEEAA